MRLRLDELSIIYGIFIVMLLLPLIVLVFLILNLVY